MKLKTYLAIAICLIVTGTAAFGQGTSAIDVLNTRDCARTMGDAMRTCRSGQETAYTDYRNAIMACSTAYMNTVAACTVDARNPAAGIACHQNAASAYYDCVQAAATSMLANLGAGSYCGITGIPKELLPPLPSVGNDSKTASESTQGMYEPTGTTCQECALIEFYACTWGA